MVGALLADRAEQELREAAEAARADHEQISVTRFLDQHGRRRAFHDPSLDLYAGGVRNRLLQP